MRFSCLLLFAIVACSDSSTPPAAAPKDAGADAGPTFCAGKGADVCADFDRGSTPAADFDGADKRNGGELALIDATSTSKPKALRSSFPALAAGTGIVAAEVSKSFDLAGKKKITLDLMARIGDAKPSGDQLVRYLALVIDQGGSIGLFRTATGWFIGVHRDNTTTTDEDEEPALSEALPIDTWTKLTLDVTLGTPGSVVLSANGTPVLTKTMATHGDAQPLSKAALVLGLSHVAGASPAFGIEIDDVTVRLGSP